MGKTNSTSPTFYHLYHTLDKDGNIIHQRGVHVKTEKPVRVKCPATGAEMTLARYTDHDTHAHLMDENDPSKHVKRNGKRVFTVSHYGIAKEVQEGDPVIYAAPPCDDVDQTADLEKEWAQ